MSSQTPSTAPSRRKSASQPAHQARVVSNVKSGNTVSPGQTLPT
ncbi:MAG: hypothetical protein WAV07_12585 [Candidatus Contendobacter sp.]